jgi:hypothetical protein
MARTPNLSKINYLRVSLVEQNMSTNQSVIETGTRVGECGRLPAIDLEHVSISQLLGRDYVFIDAHYVALPRSNPNLLHSMLDNLIAQLELIEAHTVAISVHELTGGKIGFTRHDLTWDKHKVCNVENSEITQPDQEEFMDMIWRCSTSANTI